MRIHQRLAFSILAIAVLFVSAPVRAQGVGFGLEGGIVRATLKADSATDFVKSRNGLMGGIWFGGNRNGTLGFMGEITYVVKKFDTGTASEYKLNYLEIPALLRVNLGQTKKKNGLIVYPLAGPVVDIQLKGNLNGIDIKDQFNGVDVGVIYGVGVEVARVGFEVRMNRGLRTLEKTGVGTFGGLVNTKSSAIQALVKLRIN